jgi:hypothetical protein
VVVCDILTDGGELSLAQLAEKHLDPSQPTVVITEGLVYYFDPTTIKGVWQRIRRMLKSGSGGSRPMWIKIAVKTHQTDESLRESRISLITSAISRAGTGLIRMSRIPEALAFSSGK